MTHQQLSLFDSPAQRIAVLGRAAKCALRTAVESSNFSRAEVVFHANSLAAEAGVAMCAGNGALSEATFNKWLDLTSPGHLPGLIGLTILCIVLKNADALATALVAQGLEIMGPEDKIYRDMGRAQYELKQARRALKDAESKIERGTNG